MSLDRNNVNVGYRLGRLFAVLEKIQEEARSGINATIGDRFYGAASTSQSVFPRLLKLKITICQNSARGGRLIWKRRSVKSLMG